MSIDVIGHVTKDIVEINSRTEKKIGGTAFYSGITLANLGIKTKIFTKLATKDKKLLVALKHRNISLFPYFCKFTTCFRNVYRGERREQFVEGAVEPFAVAEIKRIGKPKFVHVGPLTKNDIPVSILKYLKSSGLTVSLDVQGYLRKIRNKKISLTTWEDKQEFLKFVDVIKADKQEAKILTDRGGKPAAKALAALGPREVVITNGLHGSLIYSHGRYFRIPAFKPAVIKDVTGCGDTYAAAYLAKRLESNDLNECGLFAAKCATIKIEKGIF